VSRKAVTQGRELAQVSRKIDTELGTPFERVAEETDSSQAGDSSAGKVAGRTAGMARGYPNVDQNHATLRGHPE
jgi:hypothetical protein